MDLKISELNSLTTPTNADLVPIVNSGETKKITFLALKNALSNLSGTLNRILKFTPDGSSVGNSSLLDDGVNVMLDSGVNISSQNPLKTQISFGSTGLEVFQASTDGGALGESFILMDAESAHMGSVNGGVTSDPTSLLLVHSNIKFDATTIDIGQNAGAKTINYGISGDTHHYPGFTADRVYYIDSFKNLAPSNITGAQLNSISNLSIAKIIALG